MNWLTFMTRTDGSRVVYLWRAYLVVVIGTVVAAVLAALAFPAPEAEPDPAGAPPFVAFVFVWPVFSTLMLWGILEVARRVMPTYWHAAGAAALAWAALFALAIGPAGGLILGWPYFLFALTFLAWQLKSTLEGLAMTYALQVAVLLTMSLLVFPSAPAA